MVDREHRLLGSAEFRFSRAPKHSPTTPPGGSTQPTTTAAPDPRQALATLTSRVFAFPQTIEKWDARASATNGKVW